MHTSYRDCRSYIQNSEYENILFFLGLGRLFRFIASALSFTNSDYDNVQKNK